MNHIYRSVWNDTLGCVVAVSELDISIGKKSSTSAGGKLGCQGFALRALGLSLMVGFATTTFALPTAGVVTSGSATITSSGAGSLLITQSSQNAILNWQSFNIGAAESVRFAQPSSNSVAINRVLGSDPSQILGNLSANGKVFLVNPNGILFGKGASVNVGGLVASALDLTEADLTTGRYRFGGTGGEVTNLGSIYAEPGGSVALLGARVGNAGTISANLGSVAIAAGNAATVDVPIDGLIQVTIDKSAAHALASNGGLIQADGGAVFITAHAKDALLDTVVNNQGIVQANSVGYRNGRIVLDGGDSGLVNVGGSLRTTGTTPSTSGGTIVASGDKILVADHAQLVATGASGGGGIYVGGGWQGSDPDIRQASGVYVAQSATLDASATVDGNGGTVVAWSDVHNPLSATRVYGSLIARGGADGGDGWRIETSGHWLDVTGLRADAAAPRGNGGMWLLDPEDLTVGALPTNASTFAGPPYTFTSGAGTPNVLSADIEAQLSTGTDVVLQTAPTGAGAGDITISANIAKTGGILASLTLIAHNDIVMTGAATISSPVGALDVNFISTNNITIGAGSSIASNGGNVLLSGPTFTNNAGAAALNVSGGGQWVILSNDPSTNSFNGLISGNKAIWGGGPPPPVGNWYVFATPGAVTATTVSDSKTYGQSISVAGNVTYGGLPLTSAATYGNVYQDLAIGDALSTLPTAGSPGESSTASAGSYPISAGGGAANPGYSLGYVNSGTLTIAKAPLTVTANNASRLYGAANPALSATVSGFVNGETIGTAAGFAGSASVSTTATPTTGVGGVAITPAVGTLTAANYNFTTLQNGTLTITKAPLSVTANNDTKTYNGVAYSGGNGVAYAGFVNSETSAVLAGTLSYTGTSQGAKNAGSYVITPGGLSGVNYALSYVDGLLTISPAGLSAIVASLTGSTSKVYDGTTAATLTPGNFSLSGFPGGEGASVTKTSGTYDTAGAGTSKTVTVSLTNSDYAANTGTLLSNYILPTTVSGAVGTITKAPLTVTANSASRLYGAANPALSATVSGFVNGETIGTAAGFAGSASVSTTATPTTGVGGVAITPAVGTLTAANYNFTTLQNGTLTITKAPLSVTANNDTKTYNGVAYSGGNGVAYAGFVNSETSAVLAGTLSYTGTSQGAKNAGSYVITPGGLSGVNYALSYVDGLLTISPAGLSAIVASLTGSTSKVYDGTTAATLTPGNFSLSGFPSGEGASVTKTSGTYDTASAGTNKTVTVSLTNSDYAANTGTLLSNYILPTTVSGAVGTITKAPLTVTAVPDAKTYDGLPYAGGNGVEFRGFVNAETASVLGGALVYGGTSQGAINAGQYGISANGLTSSNYAIEAIGSTLTVNPKAVSVTGLVADNKGFDGTHTAVILNWGTAVTGVGSETLVLNHGSANFSDAIVGTGKTVTADGYSLANGTQGGLASNYVLTGTSAQTLANIVVGERAQTVADVQSSMNISTEIVH